MCIASSERWHRCMCTGGSVFREEQDTGGYQHTRPLPRRGRGVDGAADFGRCLCSTLPLEPSNYTSPLEPNLAGPPGIAKWPSPAFQSPSSRSFRCRRPALQRTIFSDVFVVLPREGEERLVSDLQRSATYSRASPKDDTEHEKNRLGSPAPSRTKTSDV